MCFDQIPIQVDSLGSLGSLWINSCSMDTVLDSFESVNKSQSNLLSSIHERSPALWTDSTNSSQRSDSKERFNGETDISSTR